MLDGRCTEYFDAAEQLPCVGDSDYCAFTSNKSVCRIIPVLANALSLWCTLAMGYCLTCQYFRSCGGAIYDLVIRASGGQAGGIAGSWRFSVSYLRSGQL